ncbi:MBL fold metallo-hydrolase [Massilia niastensis]|uniref:MBL fold metallo-hydrolase n=1 Tax=Massilia niastensis TaxID=544911 RepID=UPI0012EC4E58|nr:MBL fold metallo-hydrolase [Massilia niastensis]
MKITFVGHASILIETGGVRILSDPWWRGPCFGAQWWVYPPPAVDVLKDARPDYIYISHGHHDHLHPGTLAQFSRDTLILVAQSSNMTRFIRDMGFNVIEVGDEDIALGGEGVSCRIIPTYSDDTLMAISDGREVCLNINDALHSAPATVQEALAARLKALYPVIDYVFCGYGTASHFPNCYVIPDKNRAATAAHRQAYFNRQWARLIDRLAPRFGFPFAADVVFLEEDLQWANEPMHNSERPTDAFRKVFPDSRVCVTDIAPGHVIEDGVTRHAELRKPLSMEALRSAYDEQIVRANRYGSVTGEAIDEVARLLQGALDAHREYLMSYEGDYRFLIRFRNSDTGVLVEKRGRQLGLNKIEAGEGRLPDFDVMYTTRLHYLKNSLARRYGDEILFVGSGGIFEYADRRLAGSNLHRELQVLLKKPGKAKLRRYGNSSRSVYKLKRVVKRMLGRKSESLYDLDAWTVYASQ